MPETFISRYGLVRYTTRLSARYPRAGVCEAGLCLARQARDTAAGEALKARAEAELAALAAAEAAALARKARLLAWAPRLDTTRRRRRRELEAARRHVARIAARRGELGRDLRFAEVLLAPGYLHPPVFDHCHAHGWVRGLVCLSCNVELGKADAARLGATLEAPARGWRAEGDRALLIAHRRNCPECAARIDQYQAAPARKRGQRL